MAGASSPQGNWRAFQCHRCVPSLVLTTLRCIRGTPGDGLSLVAITEMYDEALGEEDRPLQQQKEEEREQLRHWH